MELPSTLTNDKIEKNLLLASIMQAYVSAVAPDCEIATTISYKNNTFEEIDIMVTAIKKAVLMLQ